MPFYVLNKLFIRTLKKHFNLLNKTNKYTCIHYAFSHKHVPFSFAITVRIALQEN